MLQQLSHTFFQIMLILFSAALLKSCSSLEETVDLPEDSTKPLLVVNSVAVTDTQLVAVISRSKSAFDSERLQFLEDAEVLITESSGRQFKLEHDRSGLYRSNDFYPTRGETYNIQVSNDGLPNAGGEISIPGHQLNLLEVTTRSVTIENRPFLEIKVSFDETSSTKQYYEARVVNLFEREGRPRFESYRPFYSSSVYTDNFEDSDLENSGLNYFSQRALFTNEIFGSGKGNLTLYLDNFSTESLVGESEFYVEINTITESYFLYLNTLRVYEQVRDDPFAEPVQVYSNVNNGFGVLGGINKNRIKFGGQP